MADITQVFAAAVEFHQAGDLPAAERMYRSILLKLPNHSATLCNLGAVLVRQDKLDEAAQCYAMCLAASPGYPDAHYNFGNLYRRVGQYREAIAEYTSCLRGNANHASSHFNMGLAYTAIGDLGAAAESFRQTIGIEPQHSDAYNRLGDVLLRSGQINEGIEQFRRYVALRPNDPRGLNNLGLAIANGGRPTEAVELLHRAIALNPEYADAHNTLALAYEALGKKDDATAHYREAVRINPNYADAWSNLGTNLTEQGRVDEAIDALRKSVEIRPSAAPIQSNLLLTMNYSSHLSPQEVAREHLHWGQLFAPGGMPASPAIIDANPNRRLHVGYLSGDFRAHTVAGFIELLLTNHDRTQFHVTAYAQVARPDDKTLFLQKKADRWRAIPGMNDEQLANQIRSDKIDILIDLSGHTAGNRLLAMAYRPAPIQATLFGYPNTTGLPAVDYRITDEISDPSGQTEPFYVERLLRLDGLAWAYHPPSDAPAVALLPSADRTTFTFGCLNNAAKISDECLATWAKILLEVPTSRLVLLAGQSQAAAKRLIEQFAVKGVAHDRIELVFRLPRKDYFEAYSMIDLALDPFPYNGGVTTCDALWMGVPTLTIAGASYVSRQGASILTHIGLSEFIADSPSNLIELAKVWSSNREWLAEIRAGLRSQMAKSAVADGPGYVRRLEAGLRQVWKERIANGG